MNPKGDEKREQEENRIRKREKGKGSLRFSTK